MYYISSMAFVKNDITYIPKVNNSRAYLLQYNESNKNQRICSVLEKQIIIGINLYLAELNISSIKTKRNNNLL